MVSVDVREIPGKDSRKETILFLPGFGDKVDSRSLSGLINELSSISNKVIIITSEKKGRYAKRVYEEHAEAIFDKCRDYLGSSATVIAYSEGGLKGIELARTAEKNGIIFNRLILLESVGLYRQHPICLALKFFLSGIISIRFKEVRMTFRDVGRLVISKAIFGGQIFQMMKEAKEMSQKTSFSGISIPVTAISCEKDLISDPRKTSDIRIVPVRGRYGHEFPIVYSEKIAKIIDTL